jgi:hypothetical protein
MEGVVKPQLRLAKGEMMYPARFELCESPD